MPGKQRVKRARLALTVFWRQAVVPKVDRIRGSRWALFLPTLVFLTVTAAYTILP